MAVPRNRSSRNRKGNRRSHHHILAKPLTACANCKSSILPFHICASCGHYKGRNYGKTEATASS
jgi:large subunit ribosomal protein L32